VKYWPAKRKHSLKLTASLPLKIPMGFFGCKPPFGKAFLFRGKLLVSGRVMKSIYEARGSIFDRGSLLDREECRVKFFCLCEILEIVLQAWGKGPTLADNGNGWPSVYIYIRICTYDCVWFALHQNAYIVA